MTLAMIEDLSQLFDPGALAIVLAGTLIATLARCGWRDLRLALKASARLGRCDFDEAANRRAFSRTIAEVRRAGLLGAEAPPPPDPALALALGALFRHGSFDDFHSSRRASRAAREVARAGAMRVFEYAGELAPVFGLVGTLFAITQLVPDAAAGNALAPPGSGPDPTDATLAAVATAVLSSLYGVLTAHLFCIPLARAIERKGEREEAARSRLADWLEDEIAAALRPRAPVTRLREVAGGPADSDPGAAASAQARTRSAR